MKGATVAAERVLIVGGGIAGLSLDVAMRGGRWQVELVERDAGWSRLGAGLAVQPNAMRALRELGLAAPVEPAGAVIRRFQYLDQHGTQLCDIDLDDLWGDAARSSASPGRTLHDALLPDSARNRTRRAATSVRQRNGRVSVTFDDATVAAYDLVIGADGINSDVRRSAFGRPRPATGQMVWRSVARVRPAAHEAVQFWLGSDRFFGLCPAGVRNQLRLRQPHLRRPARPG